MYLPLKSGCTKNGYLPATAANAKFLVERFLNDLPKPKYTTTCIQTKICTRYNYVTKEYDYWDFISYTEAGLFTTPTLDPQKGQFILEYVKDNWRIMSDDDFAFIFGDKPHA